MSNLINRSAVKKYILAKIKSERPGMEKKITRVSQSAIDEYEARLKNWIESDIMSLPSIGKTFKLR